MSPSKLIAFMFPFILTACGIAQNSLTQETWNDNNDPIHLESRSSPLQRYWSALPLKGELATVPWSDSYWPTHKGGLTYRWNDWSLENEEALYSYQPKPVTEINSAATRALSPIEKLDLFMGHTDYRLTFEERARTRVMKTVSTDPSFDPKFKIESWEGLCHAWAPASLDFAEPGATTLKNPQGLEIQFGSSDVKALLIYFMDRARPTNSSFLGDRCYEDFDKLKKELRTFKISYRTYKSRKAAMPCSDPNPGAFHIAMVNQIALQQKGFVVDITRDQQVWNQPVYGFETKVRDTKSKASKGAAEGTAKEITVETTLKYGLEVTQHWDAANYEEATTTKSFRYRLELNADGEIIGGTWISDDRPDFIWTRAAPKFEGDFKAIETIYKASLGKK